MNAALPLAEPLLMSMTRVRGAGRWGAVAFILMSIAPAAVAGPPVGVSSSVDGLEFKHLDSLPAAPVSAGKPTQCANYAAAPQTQAGRAAAARGWAVTGEASLGMFEAVSFAGRLDSAGDGYGSNDCSVEQGNVGIFQGGALIAIAYAAPSSKLSIGKIVVREGGGIRIWSGSTISMPIADIGVTAGGRQLQLGAVAAQETVCTGKATVPNIYGTPIDKARTALIASGWTPVPHKEGAPAPGQEDQLAKRGLIEVSACSEGLDYCGFEYRSGSVGLSVSTIGDDKFPNVTGYSAACPN